MEAKFRIIEIYPKLQAIKNNPKDIISISFISNDYTKKIGNIEQSIAKNEKNVIYLKSQNTKKELIKCILSRNNNIICSGELNLEQGTNWYKLDEIKNNKMSKESLITSSTSNDNFPNINSNINLNLIKGGSSNLSDKDNSNSIKNGSLTKTEIIKIKLMVYYIKTKNTNNNTISEQNESSVRIRDTSFEKGKNNFENSIYDMDTTKLNKKIKLMTTDKKNAIKKNLLFGNQTKKMSKNKILFKITNKSSLAPIASGDNITENNDKEISNTLNNMSFKRPSKKKFIKDANNHKPINENMKMRTSFNFYKRKNNPENNNYLIDNKLIKKKSSNKINHQKLNSCENFEDTILDQKFKNDLKNDENLRANLFTNNSFNSINKKSEEKNTDLFEVKDNNNYNENINNNYVEENNYSKDNYERLKIDFHLLYSEENIKNINNEDSFLEMQLMGEKLLKLQHFHQIEYNQIFNEIIKSKKYILNNQNLYIQLTKKMNKLQVKRLQNSLINDESFNEPISNFINVRRKIIKNSEFSIWEKLMLDSTKTSIKNNIKNKMINIFLNICSKNETKLNKLSFKFYNEIKEKQNQNKSSDKKSANKKKNNYKSLEENKTISIDTKINPHNFNNLSINKTSKNSQNNTSFMPSSKSKISAITKKIINIKSNYSNLVNETTNHSHNYNTNKNNHKSKQLNGGNKVFNSKKVVNKNQ